MLQAHGLELWLVTERERGDVGVCEHKQHRLQQFQQGSGRTQAQLQSAAAARGHPTGQHDN